MRMFLLIQYVFVHFLALMPKMRNPSNERSSGRMCAENADIVAPQTRSRPGKRKVDATSHSTRTRKGHSSTSKVSTATELPFTKDGYRYYLTEPDPFAPDKELLSDPQEFAGKPIPSHLNRIIRQTIVKLSSNDRAPQIKLSADGMVATGERGYSVIRGTHGVSRGTWFYEVRVVNQPKDSHARIGWSQPFGLLQAPVGYDKFSYCVRSRHGTRFHDSRGYHYQEPYGQGDILGLLIHLPESHPCAHYLPSTGKHLPLVRFKSSHYFEERDDLKGAQAALTPLVGSKLIFYKNGICQGEAFTDIYEGTYYPAISLYKDFTVEANFGPNFAFPPTGVEYRPMCERAEMLIVEQCLADMLYFIK
ncbi:Set1/Ash2 histone methyltransferase complex subunit ASH2 [Trichinella nelsoni]|uniref:Set1/Ash2 histone methyltransferase complex subunit ASH2 n=1 Tax=Trichinella nelsoni TaxID=6336 RepID=A0A0V0S9Q8_9BILA|nr:Set1/Ash2 histone methyltransferase complex subunit ASH2 [Trichinella nelsoni]